MTAAKSINEDILNSIGEGLFTVDKNFKINFFNRAAEEITGLKKDEVLGRYCKHVLHSELCFTKCPIGIVLESGKNIHDFESNIVKKDGARIPIKLNAAVLRNSESQPCGGVISFRDLSELDKIKKDLESKANFHGIVGHSKEMREIFNLIDEISDSDASVLIHGESGTGKEMIADSIQWTSARKEKPFIKINCSVFPENLLASELFGHIKGSFTDAAKDRIGRFELANGGTIFLDEVAEMPSQTQLQLLRVIQEGTFERIGESVTRFTDVRVIAATNLNITEALKSGKLREDLYYRLNVIPVYIPSLRSRMNDIPYLVRYFVEKYSKIYKKDITDITDESLEMLMKYNWPGNIRELENVIEYAIVRAKDNLVTLSNLPSTIKNSTQNFNQPSHSPFRNDEYAQFLFLLEKHKWNKTKVAEELGIGRTTLWRKMKQLRIEDE